MRYVITGCSSRCLMSSMDHAALSCNAKGWACPKGTSYRTGSYRCTFTSRSRSQNVSDAGSRLKTFLPYVTTATRPSCARIASRTQKQDRSVKCSRIHGLPHAPAAGICGAGTLCQAVLACRRGRSGARRRPRSGGRARHDPHHILANAAVRLRRPDLAMPKRSHPSRRRLRRTCTLGVWGENVPQNTRQKPEHSMEVKDFETTRNRHWSAEQRVTRRRGHDALMT